MITKQTEMIQLLERNGFRQTVDIIGEYSKNEMLFYTEISFDKYIEFGKMSVHNESVDTTPGRHYYIVLNLFGAVVDLWVSSYAKKEQVGRDKAVNKTCIRMGAETHTVEIERMLQELVD